MQRTARGPASWPRVPRGNSAAARAFPRRPEHRFASSRHATVGIDRPTRQNATRLRRVLALMAGNRSYVRARSDETAQRSFGPDCRADPGSELASWTCPTRTAPTPRRGIELLPPPRSKLGIAAAWLYFHRENCPELGLFMRYRRKRFCGFNRVFVSFGPGRLGRIGSLGKSDSAVLSARPAVGGNTTTAYASLRNVTRRAGTTRSLGLIEDPAEMLLPGAARSISAEACSGSSPRRVYGGPTRRLAGTRGVGFRDHPIPWAFWPKGS